MNWQGVCIHHSATRDTATNSWSAIRRYHIQHNGWNDIGYHYGLEDIDGDLCVRIGRPTDKPGAHARGINDTHLGICVVGNYDRDYPPQSLISRLALLIVDIMRAYGIKPDTGSILYHSDVSGKTCPGAHWPPKGVLLRLVTAKMEALS